ncbi:MAG TPA: substrate-binding domain-containing protein [Candidatus Deferrimicrobium sp.]|nr:substrate-binding domain-containing protein [Candidatus Deferrimicrobium sp.]
MNWRKSLTVITLGLFILSTLTGCGVIQKLTGKGTKDKQQAQKGEQKQEKVKVGVVLSQQNEEVPQIKQGLMDAAKKENIQLVFIKDPKKELEQKGKDLKALIVQGGDEQIATALQTALKQKVPIIGIDQLDGIKADAVVAPNYTRIGEIQANFLTNKLKSGGVVLLQGADPGSMEVVSGIKASLAQNPEIKIAQTFTSPSKGISPVANFNDYLKNNPGKVQAIVATDSKLAMEVIESLKQTNQEKKILVVGAGTHKEALDKVASGDLNADVDKSPYLQGMYSIKLASQLSKQQTADADSTVSTDTGETPAKLVPVRLVVPENLPQFQKTYNQPMPQEEEDKQGEQGKQQSGQDKQGSQEKQQGSQDKQQGNQDKQGQQSSKEGDQSSQNTSKGKGSEQAKAMPAGVTQVREKITTNTLREMLDKDGKVLGTEKETKEETRTLPAALVQAQQQSQQQAQQQSQGSQGKQDSGKSSEEDKSQDKKSSE